MTSLWWPWLGQVAWLEPPKHTLIQQANSCCFSRYQWQGSDRKRAEAQMIDLGSELTNCHLCYILIFKAGPDSKGEEIDFTSQCILFQVPSWSNIRQHSKLYLIKIGNGYWKYKHTEKNLNNLENIILKKILVKELKTAWNTEYLEKQSWDTARQEN